MRSHIHFGQHYKEGDFQEKTESDMFLCHFLKTHVCSNNNAAKVRGKPCKSVNGCFEVLFVTTEVDQRDDFVTIIDNLFPVFILVLVEPFRDHLFALLGEAQNFLTD